MGNELRTILVRCSGRDRPGITTGLLRVLASSGVELFDMEQVVVRERLTLDLLIGVAAGGDVLKELLYHGWENDLQLEFEAVESDSTRAGLPRSIVTVMGRELRPAALAALTTAIAAGGGNIDRIARLSSYPVISYEFVVVDGQIDAMRAGLVEASGVHGVDVAIQREGLQRRAKRLVFIDVDSTFIQDEVIELLAAEANCADEVAQITARAMAGDVDFEASLVERVALLKGTSVDVIDRVRNRIRLTPGARTLVRTLHRLGYTIALVSGGFQEVIDPIAQEFGIKHAVANRLEVVDGLLTGRVTGPVIDRAGKAAALRRIAESEGIPLEQTVAIGDGANDLDMLAISGLSIAFNAKPAVRALADTVVSVPYLDAVLFLLGIRRDEVEAADAGDSESPEH